jgi:hypothetical protein
MQTRATSRMLTRAPVGWCNRFPSTVNRSVSMSWTNSSKLLCSLPGVVESHHKGCRLIFFTVHGPLHAAHDTAHLKTSPAGVIFNNSRHYPHIQQSRADSTSCRTHCTIGRALYHWPLSLRHRLCAAPSATRCAINSTLRHQQQQAILTHRTLHMLRHQQHAAPPATHCAKRHHCRYTVPSSVTQRTFSTARSAT